MNFICSVCKERITKRKQANIIEEAGIHDIVYDKAWVDLKENSKDPFKKGNYIYSDKTPVVNEKRVILVSEPFDEEIGESFSILFEPCMMYLNGWDYPDDPNDINRISVVRCRFLEILHCSDTEGFIRVEVLNVVPINQLHKVVSETLSETPLIEEDDMYEYEECYDIGDREQLIERSWSAQGDLGEEQYIYKDKNGICHEIMHYSWDFHDEYYYVCNVVENNKK